MTTRRPTSSAWLRLRSWFAGASAAGRPVADAPALPSDSQRAHDLIAAIDAGGLPLNPARVNDIARRLGLEVSRSAPMAETIARIRAVLPRPGDAAAPAAPPTTTPTAAPPARPNPLRRR